MIIFTHFLFRFHQISKSTQPMVREYLKLSSGPTPWPLFPTISPPRQGRGPAGEADVGSSRQKPPPVPLSLQGCQEEVWLNPNLQVSHKISSSAGGTRPCWGGRCGEQERASPVLCCSGADVCLYCGAESEQVLLAKTCRKLSVSRVS